MRILSNRPIPAPAAVLGTVLVLLSGAAHGGDVFRQDFQSCDSISCYVSSNPGNGQFNDISAEPDGGQWSITQNRLQLVRTGISSTNNGAGFTRFKDFAGPPTVMHITFDFSAAVSFFRNDALMFEIGELSQLQDYSSNTPNVAIFSRLNIDLRGDHFTFEIGGAEPARFPANGTAVSISYLLNGSGETRSYLAPDGSTRQLSHNHVALWVGTALLFDNVPRTHSNSNLKDLRVRFGGPDAGTWRFDNLVISDQLPAPGTLAVTHFTLINADTDEPISKFDPLSHGAAVDFGDPALGNTRNLSVQAHTYPPTVGSVHFRLDGANVRSENAPPYALFGDNSGDYHPWTPAIGVHTLTATPFSGSNGTGTAGTPLTIHFVAGIDPRSSLAITDQTILDSRFSFQRLMDFLVTRSGVSGQTSLQLFQQWWDTQNPAPGLGLGPHCTDNNGTLNNFPYDCRPAGGPGAVSGEGSQALVNPFVGDEATNRDFYKPIGLFNRFDLAPVDGAHCGEYRLIYARAGDSNDTHPNTDPPLRRRNLVIFEAVLPNPQPALELEGCRPVVEFWANLSRLDAATRAAELERFYFAGLTESGFPPAADFPHFGTRLDSRGNPLGQIRTNQFLQQPWLLREFRLLKFCGSDSCALRVMPETVKPNPFGPLFGPNGVPPHARTGDFQSFFPSQVGTLSVNGINQIGMLMEDRFNAVGSPNALNMTVSPFENNYAFHFQAAPSSFRSAIQAAIPSGSNLTPEHIVLRAQALSCAGCHQLNNNVNIGGGLTWPPSNVFVQVSELVLEDGPDGPRSSISPALRDVFLPHRKRVLEDFLNGTPSATQLSFQSAQSGARAGKKPPQAYVPTLGGSTTH